MCVVVDSLIQISSDSNRLVISKHTRDNVGNKEQLIKQRNR